MLTQAKQDEMKTTAQAQKLLYVSLASHLASLTLIFRLRGVVIRLECDLVLQTVNTTDLAIGLTGYLPHHDYPPARQRPALTTSRSQGASSDHP